jgi:VWFA-related protein
MKRVLLAVIATLAACVLCAGVVVPAQGAQDNALSVSKADVEGFPDVKLYVSVVDPAGESIKGLTAADFTVKEDGRLMSGLSVDSLRKSGERVSIALLIDCSYSMRDSGALEAAKSGAKGFIDIMDPKDECTVISVSDKITPRLADTTGRAVFSTDKALLKQAVDGIQAEPFTRLYDGLNSAIQSVGGTTSLRKIVVVLTDALPSDERSTTTLTECLDAAKKSNVTIHAIGEGTDVNPAPLVEMTRSTGGSYYFAAAPGDLKTLYQQILANIYNEYVVRYTSPITGEAALQMHTAEVSATYGGITSRTTVSFVPTVIPARHSAAGIVLIGLAVLFLIGLSVYAAWRKKRKVCPNCSKLIPAAATVCPRCGHDFAAKDHTEAPEADTEAAPATDDHTRVMHKRKAFAWLAVTEGMDKGKTYELGEQGVFSLGRSSENDFVLDDDSVSRSHAKIEMKDGRYIVHDLASANGTFVAGARVDVADIVDGVTLQLGDELLSFQVMKKEEDHNG